MDVLTELLPPSYTAKAEPLAKDSRRQQPKKATENPQSDVQEKSLKNDSAETLLDDERRTGDDRRQQSMKRGRWLESRDKSDRRATMASLCLKV